MKTQFGRQDCDEHPGVQRIEEHLKKRVERYETRCIFGIAFRQFIPDDHHCDASGQADHDEACHVFGIAAQENHGQNEHQDWTDDPILQQG